MSKRSYLAILICLLSAGSSSAREESLCASADSLVDQYKFDKAASAYQKILDAHPNEECAAIGLAKSLRHMDRNDESLKVINAFLQKEPRNDKALLERTRLHSQRREMGSAMRDVNLAIEINPLNAPALAERAGLYTRILSNNKGMEKTLRPKILADYDAAIKANPRGGRSYLLRGWFYHRCKMDDKALSDFNKAKSLSRSGEVYRFLHDFHLLRGERRMALDAWREGLKNDPDDPALQYQIASSLVDDRKHNEAMAMADRLIASAPWSWTGHFLKARIKHDTLDDRTAIEEYTKAIAKAKENGDIWVNRATIYADMGQFEKALSDLNVARKLMPQNKYVPTYRAPVLRAMGRYREALIDYDMSIKEIPGDAGLYMGRAATHMELKDFKSANADMNKAIECAPNSVNFERRGLFYYKTGRYKDALQDFSRAIKIGRSPRLMRHRANTYEKLGMKELAKKDRLEYSGADLSQILNDYSKLSTGFSSLKNELSK